MAIPLDQAINNGISIARILKVIAEEIATHETRAYAVGTVSFRRYGTKKTGVEPMGVDLEIYRVAFWKSNDAFQ